MDKSNTIYYSDLDDTITHHWVLYYSKLIFLKNFSSWTTQQIHQRLVKDFIINEDFLQVIQSKNISQIFILSRNDNAFIQVFIDYYNTYFSQTYKCKIIGGKWKIPTIEKICHIPNDAVLISDIFEFSHLKNYPNFICIEPFSCWRLIQKKIIKTFYFWRFLIRFYTGNYHR